MSRIAAVFTLLVLALAAFVGCSSKPQEAQSQKPLDKIQGKAQVLEEQGGGAGDSAFNAGGPSIYLWQGDRRYRLFLKTKADIVHGNQYVAEGVDVQKTVDEIGDPDQGKNGYPLESSCRKAVTTAWKTLAFDDIDLTESLVRARVKRYPARPLFLVTRIRPATAEETAAAAKKEQEADPKNLREVEVAADKERGFLVEGQTTQPAPLWEPSGGTVSCKVLINSKGKIEELQTGAQLCESVQWAQFRFQPPTQAGHPVKVDTAVEVKFEPRK
jgi:hypothetical protein